MIYMTVFVLMTAADKVINMTVFVLITIADKVINEERKRKTETGRLIKSILTSGETVPDELVLKMINDKIRSAEVAHQGRLSYSAIYCKLMYINI